MSSLILVLVEESGQHLLHYGNVSLDLGDLGVGVFASLFEVGHHDDTAVYGGAL